MKTNFFYKLSRDPVGAKEFFTDLTVLLGMEKEHRAACMKMLTVITNQAMTTNQRRQLIQDMVDTDKNMEFLKAMSAVRVLQFLAERQLDDEFKEDSTADLAEDLKESVKVQKFEGISEEDAETFAGIIEILRTDILPEFEDVRNKKSTLSGVLPSLRSFGTTVELRAVVKNPFCIGMLAKDYEPNITGLVSVVSVKLRADSGVPDEFSFQASKGELEALIEELKSAHIALERIEEQVNIQWHSRDSKGKESKQ